MKYAQAIGTVEVERWAAVVLYEPRSGAIHHFHQCITLKGGNFPTRTQLERDARQGLRQAAAGRRVPRRLLALHVDPRTLDTDHHYTVDPRRRVLVKAPRRIIARQPRAPEGRPPVSSPRRGRRVGPTAGRR